ncbi:SGNH/GDSL hydrolase family protein [Trujillonella endophytica]|uniref:SGNH/GDSL hydrolase family protein n=1 Tax=Trujillonella endophytica TaxID=673521 RepID=UPI000B88CBDD|nr:SGNH/GDSL hydrolase family protein [Trujillella endophytica]
MRARPNLSRPLVIGLVLALVVIAGVAVWWTQRGEDPDEALCRTISAEVEARDDERPVATGGEVAVILGDSYSQGMLLPDQREQAWSTALGRLQGWTTYVDAIGGTGFVNGGSCGGQTFGSRVEHVLEWSPGTVVVQGGLNDADADPAEVQEAAGEVLADLSDVPRVVVVGPPTTPGRGDVTAIDAALAVAAAEADRQYVSTAGWTLPYGDDGLHPTAEGHQQFAAMVAQALAAARP